MNADELKEILDGWGIEPPDDLRTSLYLEQLRATRTFLFETLAADPVVGPVYATRFQAALRDPRLLDGFCEIIDDFLASGVSADLQAPPHAYTDYASYFNLNIFEANGGDFDANVTAFYGRYPATERAVLALTSSFQNNVRTACQRIQRNWDDLTRTFAPPNGQLQSLSRIQSTGSDFHKGGQQVLILAFDVLTITPVDESAHLSDDRLKLVYKPSDLEADCLIIGDSAAVNNVHPGFQQQSLFEIINALVREQRAAIPKALPLPTYKILPYNYGSSLEPSEGRLPIRDSYGYIQFLAHEHAPGWNIFSWYSFGSSDFKILESQDVTRITRSFYQQLGEFLAIACSFSIVDMHIENIIVSKYQPFPIDLEISLTRAITDVDNTEMFGDLGGITGLQRAGVDYDWVVDGSPGRLYLTQAYSAPYAQNRLWTTSPDEVIEPSNAVPANTLMSGFRDGLALIRSGVLVPANNRFNAWFTRLVNVVVRYVPYATKDFKDVRSQVYSEAHAADADYLQRRLLMFLTSKYEEYQGNPRPQPDFVAVDQPYTLADYQNCDIPIFYHRIGTTGLMDSRGVAVVIPETLTVLDPPPPDKTKVVQVRGPLGRDTFFALPPTTNNVQNPQVNALANFATFDARRQALQSTLLTALGLVAPPPLAAHLLAGAHA